MTLCLMSAKSDRDYIASATIRLAGPASDLRSIFRQPVCCSHALAFALRPFAGFFHARRQHFLDRVHRPARGPVAVGIVLEVSLTAPGVGPITALCFLATIDDPTRLQRRTEKMI